MVVIVPFRIKIPFIRPVIEPPAFRRLLSFLLAAQLAPPGCGGGVPLATEGAQGLGVPLVHAGVDDRHDFWGQVRSSAGRHG